MTTNDVITAWLQLRETTLTQLELDELHRIATGVLTPDAAEMSQCSIETIRARRKRLYRSLKVYGKSEILKELLEFSLGSKNKQ